MFELPSAQTFIAGGNEFLFARFYDVYEGVQLVLPEVRPLSPVCRTCPVGLSKRGRDTESDANIPLEEMLTFFSNEFPVAFPHEIPKCVSYNITYQRKA